MALYKGLEKITPAILKEGSGTPVINTLTIEPSVNSQTYTASGGVDGYSPVTVNAVTSSIDSNISPENIKKNVVILGVAGEYEGGGSTDKKKFDLGIDSFIGNTVNGTLNAGSLEETDLVFTGVTNLGYNALRYAFYGKNVETVSFPNLTTISGFGSLQNAFSNNNNLESASFPLLRTITGDSTLSSTFSDSNISSVSMPLLESITGSYCVSNMFSWCRGITSISLPSLRTIGNSSGRSWFYGCDSMTSVSMPLLESIGSYGAVGMFQYCSSLTRVDFPKLTSVQINSFQSEEGSWEKLFGECNSLEEIHFRADMANVIPNMIGYSSLWGATNATVYFDLASATLEFDITPSQGTEISVDGITLSGTTINVGYEGTHNYSLINSSYPIYCGSVSGLVEGSTTTVTKDLTNISGHTITLNTNVSGCIVTFNYNGYEKSATTLSSTSYQSDSIYTESSITIGYTVECEGYFTKTGTITFNNSDVVESITLVSNDVNLDDYDYYTDSDGNIILTSYLGNDTETLVIPNIDE